MESYMWLVFSILVTCNLALPDAKMLLNYGVTFKPIKSVFIRNSYVIVPVDVTLPTLLKPIIVSDVNSCRQHLQSKNTRRPDLCREFITDFQNIVALQKKANDKITDTLLHIGLILDVNSHVTSRTRRSSDGLLPVVGEVSEFMFGTATVAELKGVKSLVNSVALADETNVHQILYLGNALKAVVNITQNNVKLQMQSVLENTEFLLNLSRQLDIYKRRKHVADILRQDTLRMEMENEALYSQLTRLTSDVRALGKKIIKPSFINLEEMERVLQAAATIVPHQRLRELGIRLPTVSEMYDEISLLTEPRLTENGTIIQLSLKVPLIVDGESFYLYQVNKFRLPFHGHYTQLFHIPEYVIISESQKYMATPDTSQVAACTGSRCYMDILTRDLQNDTCLTALYNVNRTAVKSLCDFRLVTGHSSGSIHVIDSIHFLLANIKNVKVTCNSSTIQQKGCSSCVRTFPCGCLITADTWYVRTPADGCVHENHGPKILYPVNMASLQHLNMTLTNILDPARLYSEPIPISSLNEEIQTRQKILLAKEHSNYISLGKYVKAITQHQKEFNREHLDHLQVDFGHNIYAYWANRLLTFVVSPLSLLLIIILCARAKKHNREHFGSHSSI